MNLLKIGIIIVSMLLSSNEATFGQPNTILLDTVTGSVSRENFTYWSLGYTGHIRLMLHSLEGDADLYITDKEYKPTYDPEFYELHSATCGIDVVEIPRHFNRPVSIGIYGYSMFTNSTYVLEVFYDIKKSHIRNLNDDDGGNSKESNEKPSRESEENHSDGGGVKKYKLRSKIMSGIWPLLKIFDIIFTF